MVKDGLTIQVADDDTDYLGLEVRAVTERFARSTFVYASGREGAEAERTLEGFPHGAGDERVIELGTREEGIAGGYCRMVIRCGDRQGHLVVRVTIRDDDARYGEGMAEFEWWTEPAAVDLWVSEWRAMDAKLAGSAYLAGR